MPQFRLARKEFRSSLSHVACNIVYGTMQGFLCAAARRGSGHLSSERIPTDEAPEWDGAVATGGTLGLVLALE